MSCLRTLKSFWILSSVLTDNLKQLL